MARQADLNRGWGKYCSKSCKASEQEKRTGQHAKNKTAIVSMGHNRSDGLLRALQRHKRFMVMVGDDGKDYIDPEDDGIPEDDF